MLGRLRRLRRASLVVASLLALAATSACKDNMFGGNVVPVPPVHRVPPDVEGIVILVAEDPEIESHDPVHVDRATNAGIPRDFRASMVNAFQLAGFRVVQKRDAAHDLEARLALKVDEDGGKVHQVYRCGLRTPEGTEVAQIDWAWPEGTYVDVYEVLDFATHNVATEVATSRRVMAYVRSQRGGGGGGAGGAGTKDAGPTN